MTSEIDTLESRLARRSDTCNNKMVNYIYEYEVTREAIIVLFYELTDSNHNALMQIYGPTKIQTNPVMVINM